MSVVIRMYAIEKENRRNSVFFMILVVRTLVEMIWVFWIIKFLIQNQISVFGICSSTNDI